MRFDFTGAGVALVTPFREDWTIDWDALGRIIDNQAEAGIDFLVALGTTSETPALDEEEKARVLAFVTGRAAGRLPVVAGFGGNDTRAMLKKMESYPFEGISGLLVVTPYYNKPGQEGLFLHFREIADHSPVPVIMYNVPTRTGVNLEAETVIRLSEASENIAAVKEASGILSQITRIVRYSRPGFRVLSGDDVLALPIIAIGGAGLISVIANALPDKLASLVHHALNGDYQRARELHFEMIELFRLQFRDGNPAGVKTMLHYQGIIRNVLRLPLTPATEETRKLIVEELQKLA